MNSAAFTRILAGIATIVLINVIPATASVPLKPVAGKQVTIIVDGNDRLYYLATRNQPVQLKVSGPAKLEIITRFALPAGNSSSPSYAINVTENKSVVKRYSTSSEPSDAKFTEDQSIYPARSRKFTIQVPEGEHLLSFSAECDNLPPAAALRFLLTKQRGSAAEEKEKMSRIEPLSYDRVATAVVAEKLITYYVSSRQKPVMLRIVGPTTVSVDARLNFVPAMQGAQTYLMTVTEGVQSVLKQSFETTKSAGAYYQDWKEVVPGKINKFSFSVTAGEHIFKCMPGEGLAGSVALKFSIPEKDLRNAE